jgi:hypothetical protein
MAKTIVGVFDDFTAAVNTLPDLVSEGIPREEISIVTPDTKGEYAQYLDTQPERSVAEDVGVGAVLGGLGGFLLNLGLSLGALTLPGIGPVVVAGPLLTTLAGALVGAEAGGLVRVLRGLGVAEYEAKAHAESVRQGSTLVIVKAEDKMVDRARAILQQHHAENIEQRSA